MLNLPASKVSFHHCSYSSDINFQHVWWEQIQTHEFQESLEFCDFGMESLVTPKRGRTASGKRNVTMTSHVAYVQIKKTDLKTASRASDNGHNTPRLKTNLKPQSYKSGKDLPLSLGICKNFQCCSKNEFRNKWREASSRDKSQRDWTMTANFWSSLCLWLDRCNRCWFSCHFCKSGKAVLNMWHKMLAKCTQDTLVWKGRLQLCFDLNPGTFEDSFSAWCFTHFFSNISIKAYQVYSKLSLGQLRLLCLGRSLPANVGLLLCSQQTSSFCYQTKRHDDRLEGSDKPFACFQRSDSTSAQVELRVSSWAMKNPNDPAKTLHPIHLELPGIASLHHIETACHRFGVFAAEWAIEKATDPHPGSELKETDTALNLHFRNVCSPGALQWCQRLWFSHWAWGMCVGCNVVQDLDLSSWSSQYKGSWTKQWYYLPPGAAASLRCATAEDLADKLGRHQKAKNL